MNSNAFMMKIKICTFLFFFISMFISIVWAQTPEQDQKRRAGFQSTIDKFEENRKSGLTADAEILFIGSSSFYGYVGFEEDYADFKAVNLGFGGSQMSDVLYFFDSLVKPYDPKHILIYEGDNDLNAGLSVDDFMADVKAFVRLVRIYKPGTMISFVSPKPSPARKNLEKKYHEAQKALFEYANRTPGVEFIDVSTPMYRLDGKIRPEIWKNDSLHLNRIGYEKIWTPILRAHLRE